MHTLRDLYPAEDRKQVGEKLTLQYKRFAWHVRKILIQRSEYFCGLLQHLGEPDVIWSIPLHQTTQVPCQAMKIKQSSVDGNIWVVDNLHTQGGIGDPRDKGFLIGYDVDMSEWVIVVHGDLLTKERLDSIKESRSIEDGAKQHFQQLIFLPGLFHYKMACADVFWRTWVKPKEARMDENSIFEHVGVLRPDNTGKFVSNPGFRCVHDVIHHDL